MQDGLNAQEASDVSDLSFQSAMYFSGERVKWLHYNVQVVLLSLAFPGSDCPAVYDQRWMQYAATGVNAPGVLRFHDEVSLAIAEEVCVKTR